MNVDVSAVIERPDARRTQVESALDLRRGVGSGSAQGIYCIYIALIGVSETVADKMRTPDANDTP